MCFCLTSGSIEPLPDGLLLTRADQLRVQSSEWTILVVMETPLLDPDLMRNINMMIGQVRLANAKGLITASQRESWKGRLKFLKVHLQGIGAGSKVTVPRRVKRGWFDFIGQIGHTLFGLATDDSIEQCRQAIVQTRKYQQEVVHQINKLTTVLNRTHSAAMWNRNQITQVTAFISSYLVPKLNEVITNLNSTNDRLNRLERAFYFERVVATLEQVTLSYMRLRRTHARQKASLELGRLTEDILSVSQLRTVLGRAATTTTYPVEPIQWYYEHAHIYPVWGKDTLIYRLKLPLVDGRKYNRYNLVTWPVPYAHAGYSIHINVDHRDVGMDIVTGDIFHPIGCMGWKPMVCRSGPLYSAHRWGCPRTLISGEYKRSKNCQVTIRKQQNLTQVTEISYGEYVVVTWGETFETRCEGQSGIRNTVPPGTYLIAVPPGCTVMGKGVTLTGLIERVGHVSVRAMRVLASNILNITDIVPAEQAISLLSKPHFDQRAPLAKIDLTPLPDPPVTFDWTYHGTRMSFGVTIILVVLSVILVISLCLCWYKRETLKDRFSHSKVEREITYVRSGEPTTVDSSEASPNNPAPPDSAEQTVAEVEPEPVESEPLMGPPPVPSHNVFNFQATSTPRPNPQARVGD